MSVELSATSFKPWLEAYRRVLDVAGLRNYHAPLLQYLEHLESVCLAVRGQRLRYWFAGDEGRYCLPLLEIPDQFSERMVLTHPYDCNHYDLHCLYYSALAPYLRPMAETVGVDAHWPLVADQRAQHPSFRDYLRWLDRVQHLQLQSHFFGAKSERINWRCERLDGEDHLDLLDLAIQHNSNHAQRGEANSVWAASSLLAQANGRQTWVCARDLAAGGSLVAAMLCTPGHSTTNADVICHNTDSEYRPYSLVNCALVAAVREFVYGSPQQALNLGVNFEPQDYKTVFGYRAVPVYNLPLVPPEQTGPELSAIFRSML